jgi:hypothetical protein
MALRMKRIRVLERKIVAGRYERIPAKKVIENEQINGAYLSVGA